MLNDECFWFAGYASCFPLGLEEIEESVPLAQQLLALLPAGTSSEFLQEIEMHLYPVALFSSF